MASNPDNMNPTADSAMLDEQLVAYLDGELDEQGSRLVEEMISANPRLRRRMDRLGKAWELLDQLEPAQVGDTFTQTTLEIVAVAAEEDAEQLHAETPRLRRRQWLRAGGSLVAAAAAGFLAVALLWPDPDGQWLRDLPVLENLDEYRQIDNIEFLRMLCDEGMFTVREDADEP